MIKEIIEQDKTVILWQDWADDFPGEPALVIRKYPGSLTITQEGREILISSHELKAFIKELKEFL